MSQGVAQSSFAQVLADWAKQEEEQEQSCNTEPFAHSRPHISEIDTGSPIIFQNTFVGESHRDSEIRLYGVNEAGCSILVRVQDFRHHFFLAAPYRFKDDDAELLRNHSNNYLNTSHRDTVESPIYDIRLVEKKLTANHPNARLCTYKNMFTSCRIAGRDVPYILRFMIDNKIQPMQWLRIFSNEYSVAPIGDRISNCQLEVSIKSASALEVIENPGFAPFRILSFDIETDVPNDGKFPTSDKYPSFQIGCTLAIYGQSGPPPYRTIFTLDACSVITGAQVRSFATEAEMLTAWQKFFIDVDPDIVTGYNTLKFDTPYLLGRANVFRLKNFAFLGRIKGSPQVLPQVQIDFVNSPGYDGRLLLDMNQQMFLLEKGPNHPKGWFRLDNVCNRILRERKEEMIPQDIPKLQRGGPDDRRRLAIYCLKDTYLPLRLMSHLDTIEKETERAKALRLPMNLMRKESPDLEKYASIVEAGLEAVERGTVL